MTTNDLPLKVKEIMAKQPLNNLGSAPLTIPVPADGEAGRKALVSLPLETIPSE